LQNKHINTKRYLRKGRRQQSAEEKRKVEEKRRKRGRGRRGKGEGKGKGKGEISVRFSRARMCARIPTAILFFYCHKCHTQGENWRKIDGKRIDLEEIQENTTRKDVFFSVVLSTF
jgi:hypothetical protein